jgi:very-short-patch-repair endonuclease
MRREIIPYNPRLTELARQLRNNSTKSEIKLWLCLKGKQFMGYDFHRQKPIDEYILDFICHELMLGIELDGLTHSFDGAEEKDERKENRMKELGITILRFNDDEVHNNLSEVLRIIEAYIINFEENLPKV